MGEHVMSGGKRAALRDGWCVVRMLVCAVVVVSCGGGSSAPPDTAVVRIDVSPSGPVSVVSGATSTFTATAYNAEGKVVSGQTFTWTTTDSTVGPVAGGVATARLVGTASIDAHARALSSPL